MSTAVAKEQGACLCGAVRLQATFSAREMGACHCSMCRRWSGGVFLAVECRDVEVENAENVGVYASSEWGERCFCKVCGSTLMWRSKDGTHHALSVHLFEDPSGFALTSQIFIDEKSASYSFAEPTRNMTGPEFVAMVTGAAQ
ncbi:GFA family protein [Xanthomonas rydalmerensis]|uniref:GFA family protein n=1 Tax=Xanthomonas rydalmerensis TaxID=3046274 RepID=A0ABZ0JKA6_9XANT|nr:GFA family protein [Xanthomonas sp. DM-2023]WOS40211.1 GFA family protein [Xanthomonas sp. DM-2023]WOS44395.1 GFA family protein [Xanthomonas sp. DM-2023]WOS48575.1 GFA family protein [Xanthomonas sp. DM-2023]WOS52755.1 GFA family protein [Xanthomonas sp. DM-2023]WOS56939.1 GFA family protein [Xanthomonas sp. DM-2023]